MKGPLGDVRVRRALSMALDRKGFVKAALAGAANVSTSLPVRRMGRRRTPGQEGRLRRPPLRYAGPRQGQGPDQGRRGRRQNGHHRHQPHRPGRLPARHRGAGGRHRDRPERAAEDHRAERLHRAFLRPRGTGRPGHVPRDLLSLRHRPLGPPVQLRDRRVRAGRGRRERASRCPLAASTPLPPPPRPATGTVCPVCPVLARRRPW